MANPLLQMLQVAQPNISSIVQAYKTMQNPNAMIQNNPQLQSILSLYNGNAQQAFYALCKQKGIDPQTILNQLK